MDKTAELLFEYLKNVLYHPNLAHLDPDDLDPEFRKFAQGPLLFTGYVQEEQEFLKAIAKGDLSFTPPDSENVLAAPLKELQASLRHLTWQTKQIAKGDYSQRVDFMGEFSDCFNVMVAQLAQRELTAYQLSYRDPLTGLNNRRYALETANRLIADEVPFLLSFIDIDYLKYCNDSFGHDSGDHYLLDTANALKIMHGELCRIGGDEFLLITPGTDAEEQDRQLGELRSFLLSQAGVPYPQSFSFATCKVPAHPEISLEEYIKEADAKMYEYKLKNKKKLSDIISSDDRTV